MAIQSITPYLLLGDKAEAAIELYKAALDARVESLARFGDVDDSCPEAMRDQIMHAELRMGTARLMLSAGAGPAPAGSGNISVALALNDQAETRRRFEALSAGGQVVQPLMDSPWGSLFGVVTDQFGVSWMFDCMKA